MGKSLERVVERVRLLRGQRGSMLDALPYMTANAVQLSYEERGSGTRILGIHGGRSSAVFWEDAAERLSELGRRIMYDRRGSDGSDR